MSTHYIRAPGQDFVVIIPRSTARDERLSYRARGVLQRLLSNAEGFSMSAVDLAREGREGRDAIRAALRELKNAGYIVQRATTNAARQFTGTEAYVYSIPQTGEHHREPENPQAGNPPAGFPSLKSSKGSNVEKSSSTRALPREPVLGSTGPAKGAAPPTARKKPGAPWRLVSGVRVYHGTDDDERLEALQMAIGEEAFRGVIAALPSPRYVSHIENAVAARERERARERAEAERHQRVRSPCESAEEAARKAQEQMRAYAEGGAP